MRNLKALALTTVVLLFFNYTGFSQNDPVVKKIIEIGKIDNRAMQHLDVLSNRIGGRLIGSDAYANATKWAAREMEKWGMQVSVEVAGTMPVGFNRGPWFGRLMGDNAMTLHFVTPSYTSGTKGVQTGHVLLEPKSQEEFDRMKGRLKGAWVLIGGKSNGFPIDISAKADKRRDSIIAENNKIADHNRKIQMAKWSGEAAGEPQQLKEEPALFYRQMKDAGILGIIQSAPVPLQALYDRKNCETFTFETLPTVPDIKLDEHQYAVIEQMAKERRNFFLEFDIRNHFVPGPIEYHNVIGIIPGTKYPNEYVIMSGHLDAFDVATGGVDCGSGVTPTMEAARLIMAAGGKPKRTILVCLFAGEEFGLYGSKAWVEKNREKLPKISNVFNRDYGPLATTNMTVPEAMMADMKEICAPVAGINPEFPFEVKQSTPRARPKVAGGSDAGTFMVEGVPALGLGTSDVKGYNFDYSEIWHTERDTYNMSIEEYQKHTAIVTAVVVYGVANLNHLLSRTGLFKEEKLVQ